MADRTVVGIIPARAGFTKTKTPTHTPPQGSSPLARGLPTVHASSHKRHGIIPARAGFTGRPPWRRRGVRDHPRSRGVYCENCPTDGISPGSSPLARGLLARRTTAHATRWIIPARAGFTCSARLRNSLNADHPRSRGVYLPSYQRRPKIRGSSPLARGLRLTYTTLYTGPGIIPARAGFTSPRRPSPGRDPDHPRSRGVYPAFTPDASAVSGSSPLARGLQPGRGLVPGTGGIIPARAGFT